MKKNKVVYTALTGAYDGLIQHSYVDPDYDYICFSNDFAEIETIGHWKIRKIDYKTNDNQLLSRFPKLQPYKLLSNYDYSLYVDANVDILNKTVFDNIKNLYDAGVLLAGVNHLTRKCLYKESLMVILRSLDSNRYKVFQLMKLFMKDGFPLNYGMYEANVIFRVHNNPLIIKQCDEWWYYRLNYSRRDQLSYSYTLWKNNIPFNYILPVDQSTKNGNNLNLINHNKHTGFLYQNFFIKLKNLYYALLMKLIFPFYQYLIKH